MSKELRDEYQRLHGKPATKKSPGITKCICSPECDQGNMDEKDCPCPLHFATWKAYLKSKVKSRAAAER